MRRHKSRPAEEEMTMCDARDGRRRERESEREKRERELEEKCLEQRRDGESSHFPSVSQ